MTTNVAHVAETAFLVLAAYLLGCVIGYTVRRLSHGASQVAAPPALATARPRPRSSAARLAASVEGDTPSTQPKLKPDALPKAKISHPQRLSGPRNGVADNLKRIKGIGPKIEVLLHEMGVFHLDQIAEWTGEDIDWIDARLAFKGRIRRERWVEQAADIVTVQAHA